MRLTPSFLLRAFLPLVLGGLLASCEGCFGPGPGDDAGEDGGPTLPDGGTGRPDGGAPVDGGGLPDGSTGPLCGENTPGFGEPCGDCGSFVCDQQTDELFCYDRGFNDCGGCGDIDTSAGRLNDPCGEHGCGVVRCNDEGTAMICEGDHERNVCGGCGDIMPPDLGEPCSACGTGTRTCTRDQDALVCWRGRAPNNQCNSCDPCVQYHAFMDERLGGGYLRTGTVAVFEDAGNGQQQMVFLPLVEGPGAAVLPLAHLLLTNTPEPELTFPSFGCFADVECPGTQRCIAQVGVCIEGAWLPTPFAANVSGLNQIADPVRSYSTVGIDPGAYRYLVLYDWFLERVVSLGEIVEGPPPGLLVDGGVPTDGGLDDGGTTSDGFDAGTSDAGELDGGAEPDELDAGDDAGDVGEPDPGDDAGAYDGG